MQLVRRRFVRHKLAMSSLVLLLLVVLMATIGRWIWKWNDTELVPGPNGSPLGSTPPSWAHPFGTDTIGHDMFARVMRGTEISLAIAFLVALISTTIGVVLGAISGFVGGWVDGLIMRTVDLLLIIPLLALAAVLGRKVSGASSWYWIGVILALFSWTSVARIIRGEFLSLREKEFVEAARALGASAPRIIFRHMLPNVIGSIIVNATLIVAAAILTETALSYLGLGVKEPDSSLGLLVSLNQTAFSTRPWLFWFPGLFIVIIALTVNFIGDGLRDAFDPKQTRVRA